MSEFSKLLDIESQLSEEEVDFLHSRVRSNNLRRGKVSSNLKWRRMAVQNSKLRNGESRILLFSLPPGPSLFGFGTCLNSKSCASECYAQKAYNQYSPAKHAWQVNETLARTQLNLLKILLLAQIQEEKSKHDSIVIRVHSSGDFFSQEYIDMWTEVAFLHPEIRFFAYTKVKSPIFGFDFSGFPQNFNLIDSFINGKRNFGKKKYIERLVAEGAFLCPSQKGTEIKCIRDCTYCLTNSKPVFLKH